jgi:hypothetical protein
MDQPVEGTHGEPGGELREESAEEAREESAEEAREESAEEAREGTGNEQPTQLQDSSPNAGGPDRAAGGLGMSSERVGPTGGAGPESTDGEKDTTAPRHRDHSGDPVGTNAEFDQGEEANPEGIDPKAGYPSHDPRSKDAPYKDA